MAPGTVTNWLHMARHQRMPRCGTFVFVNKNWRRRPDLNRGWRFCRPLPYHLATAPVGSLIVRRYPGRVLGTRTTACPAATGGVMHVVQFVHERRTDKRNAQQ